jgi:hypothetical protein
MQGFKDRYFAYRKKLLSEKKKREIQNLDKDSLSVELKKLSRANAWNPDEMDIVKQVIIENNYYISGLHGKVNDLDWSIVISVCSLCRYTQDDNYRKGLLKCLQDYINQYSGDNACKQRVNSLIKQHQLEK